MNTQLIVDGEPLDVLIQIIPYLKVGKRRNGTVNVTAEAIPKAVMAPFLRALMRREARLIREDADQVDEHAVEPRTANQRRADAFVDLILNISAAEKYDGRLGR